MAMWCHQHMLGDYKGRYRAGQWIKNDGKKKSLLTASLQQLGGKKKKGANKGGGFLPPIPPQISPLKCQLNCSIFSWFSDSAGKDLWSVWEEMLLAVPAAGQEVAKTTLQLSGGVPLPPTQIRGLIPSPLLPRASLWWHQQESDLDKFWTYVGVLREFFGFFAWKGSRSPG